MTEPAAQHSETPAPDADIVAALGNRCVVLVGMMGVGKSTIGRRLAARLHLPFRDADDVYAKKNIKVFGVSIDDEKSHQKFIEKYKLPFDLLADTDKKIVEKYGVWGEKSMYGRKYMGTLRKTFLIGEDGKIVKIFDKVKVAEHADEVLKAFGEA